MLYRIKGRATKCAPSAISAIASIHTEDAARIIRRLFDRKTVNGAYMDELAVALIALSGHIHSMVSKALPPDRPLAFDTVCNTQEIAVAVLFSAASSLPEYPGLRPRTATKRRRPGVHAFLVEGEEAAILQRDGQYWRIYGFGEAGRCHAATTLAGVKRYCEIFAFGEAEKTHRYRIAKRERIARLLTIDHSPGVWREVRRILENPLDRAAPKSPAPLEA